MDSDDPSKIDTTLGEKKEKKRGNLQVEESQSAISGVKTHGEGNSGGGVKTQKC